jgi:alpha-D-ribose 1-methylphosphonate 5-triphosphate synthase subunit PhnL
MATQTIGTVNVRVNSSPSVRVQSINYLPAPGEFVVREASDVVIMNSANNNSVLTYDNTTQKFVVQNVPRLNGGTF